MIHLNLDKEKKYLLACSFGPDSMALFHLLVKNKYNFACAIVNYHLREESDDEVEGLVEYAKKFDIKVHVLDVKEKIEKNVEARCREIRYQFFKELTDEFELDSVLVAHHQDDVIETYLLQKERQNCPIYYGIKEKTTNHGVPIIRPLLDYSKKELIDICVNNNVPYAVDKSNFDVSINRNRIRHKLVAHFRQRQRQVIIDEINQKNEELKNLLEK